jgi:hypothetical protein
MEGTRHRLVVFSSLHAFPLLTGSLCLFQAHLTFSWKYLLTTINGGLAPWAHDVSKLSKTHEDRKQYIARHASRGDHPRFDYPFEEGES